MGTTAASRGWITVPLVLCTRLLRVWVLTTTASFSEEGESLKAV